MRNIQLKRISLVNFKGITEKTVDFDGMTTTICGRNGAGKTSLFDAFCWVLFGKDSQDRKVFDIKAYGTDGKTIDRLIHEVTVWLDVDGDEVVLRKQLVENWGKDRGVGDEVLKGNDTKCFYNDVPMSASEYNERIKEVCNETMFKLATNPLYFTAQKEQDQRKMLFKLAGDINDAEIVAGHDEFAYIVEMLAKKTSDDIKKEYEAKRRTIREEIDSIPARIEENSRTIASSTLDWDDLQSKHDKLVAEKKEATDSLTDINKAAESANAEKARKISEASRLHSQYAAREAEIERKVMHDFYEAQNKKSSLEHQIEVIKRSIRSNEDTISAWKSQLATCNAELDALRAEYAKINGETFVFDDNLAKCAYCGHDLDPEQIDEKKQQMLETFNASKAKRMQANKDAGVSKKAKCTTIENDIKNCEAKIFSYKSELDAAEKELKALVLPEKPDASKVKEEDEELLRLREEIAVADAEANKPVQIPSCEAIKARISSIESDLTAVIEQLSGKKTVDSLSERNAELKEQIKTGNAEIAKVEKVLYDLIEYNKLKVSVIESRVNSLFSIVRFRLFRTLINGKEEECCEAMVDGTPFGTRSASEKINMGLDIINAFCKHYEIYAPIFIDNRETITDLLPVESQVINLKVDEHYNQLTVINN